ncbi:MAG: hypothetical protein WCG94_07560 [Methanothrix sp.]
MPRGQISSRWQRQARPFMLSPPDSITFLDPARYYQKARREKESGYVQTL